MNFFYFSLDFLERVWEGQSKLPNILEGRDPLLPSIKTLLYILRKRKMNLSRLLSFLLRISLLS